MPRKPQYGIASDVPLVLYDAGFSLEMVSWNQDLEAHKKVESHFTELLMTQFSLQTAVVQCIMGKLQESAPKGTVVTTPVEVKEATHIKLIDRKKEETYEERKAVYDRRMAAKAERKAAATGTLN